MPIVTIDEAKTNLSELLRRVEAGEEITVARGTKPIAVLKAFDDEITRRRKAGRGCLEGKFPAPSDSALFDPMSEEELALWYDGPIFPEERQQAKK